MRWQWLLVILIVCAGLTTASTCCAVPQAEAQAEAEAVNWRERRSALDRDFRNDLQAIANWCRANGIPQQVAETFKLNQNRDLSRHYIFLPTEKSMPTPPEGLLGQWLEQVNEAKIRQGDRIFELAKQAADQEAGAVAYRLLHEVIFFNRDHLATRKTLGHRKTEDGWRVASDSLKVSQSNRPHDLIQWSGDQFITVRTPHFQIDSNASEERTRYLAEKLERWHLVWQQVFFEYWSNSRAIQRWIGEEKSPTNRRKFRVVFFQQKAGYIAQVGRLVRGVGVSTGYYSPEEEVSFFYDGDDRVQDTWRHELTHQLFRETPGSKARNFESRFIWLDEGIATYFESLADFGDYVTLGGFEARRIQFSRIRRLLENFHIPMAKLSEMGRQELQNRSQSEMQRIYSEAAGLTDFLMNDQHGAYEKSLIEFLELIHKRRPKPGSFEKIIGKKFEELDAEYVEFLKVDSKLVENHLSLPATRTELSVPGANLGTLAYEAIGQCVNLTWLDLSQNSITADQFSLLQGCRQINQLILTECRFENQSLRGLELFPLLDDLDLSGSSVQDFQLASFRNLTRLKSLSLTQTAITDQGLIQLANVPSLRTLNVSRTQVTPQGIANLKSRLPNLTVAQ